MYDYLLKYVSPRWANIGMVLWYTALVLLILYLLQIDEADFRYIDY